MSATNSSSEMAQIRSFWRQDLLASVVVFLVALPPEVIAPLMIFIGCWQLPMYLTPILLPRLYAWALRDE